MKEKGKEGGLYKEKNELVQSQGKIWDSMINSKI